MREPGERVAAAPCQGGTAAPCHVARCGRATSLAGCAGRSPFSVHFRVFVLFRPFSRYLLGLTYYLQEQIKQVKISRNT